MRGWIGAGATFALALTMVISIAASPESKRMSRAKDFIADEQWTHAVEVLRAAVADPKEPNRDEALFWLAQSEYQAGDPGAALETIARLEREAPSSRWVHPARSLRIEIAQRLRRDDVLWLTATPPPARAPVPPAPAPQPTSTPVPPVAPQPPTRLPKPAAAAREPLPPPPAPPAPPATWVPQPFAPDVDLRIEALSSLMPQHAERVIPLLKEIALQADDPEARRAVFVLAQSSRPEARRTVVELARQAAEPVRVAAVRELGRFGGADVSKTLLQVYADATVRVKREVVTSLGERADAAALFQIAKAERDPQVRNTAIVTLGRAGARDQLRTLYDRGAPDARTAVLVGLFNARDEDELIKIAEREQNPALRREALFRLRLLGTEKARQYLAAHPSEKR
jgi:hypothetical protein